MKNAERFPFAMIVLSSINTGMFVAFANEEWLKCLGVIFGLFCLAIWTANLVLARMGYER